MEHTNGGVGVGESLRRLRLRAGLNQRDLAEKAGVSVRTLRYIETGGVGRPHATSIDKLACVLGLPADRLAALTGSSAGGAGPQAIGPDGDELSVEVLGPLTVRLGGNAVGLGSAMRRALLGLLAVQPGQVVGVDEIVDLLWPDEPPRTCLELVSGYAAQVRRLLEPGRRADGAAAVLSRAPGGYRLDLGPEQSDLVRFRALADRAARAWSERDARAAIRLHREAWSCWRGPLLAGSDPRLRTHPAVVGAAQRRITATAQWSDAALALAEYEQVLGPLRILHAEEPLHEGIAARLMLALAGSGQQAAALSLFESVRRRLDTQLGVAPGAKLRAAHLRVLRGRLPGAADGGTGNAPAGAGRPAQLPADVAGFTGRDGQLDLLDTVLADTADASDSASVPPRLAVIAGAGGVGKTALAVRWAHRVRGRFPDGQLYVNLRGHASGRPVHPLEALAGFLVALGIAADRVPDDEQQAAALYRSLLSNRRVLIVLDNAADAEQVRPLLPAGPGTVALVTARHRLAGLVARDGALLVRVDVLSQDEAVALLGRMLGAPRTAAEPEATARLARLCAGLPLALRIAAANLAGRPQRCIADYADRLAEGDRLGTLAVDGDATTAVRATFELSCAALPAAERRLFRLLGLLPEQDATAAGAAAAAGIEAAQAERLLDRLADRHLVDEHLPGRYTMHDLLRLHAAELARREEDPASGAAALRGLAEYATTGTASAARLLYPHLLQLPEVPADADRSPFRDGAAAMAWLDAERANHVALVVHLAQHGHHAQAWRLAGRLNGYFVLRKHTLDWLTVAEAADAAASADGDLHGRAYTQLHLGMAHDAAGRGATAAAHYTRSAELAELAGWSECQAVALNNRARFAWLNARVPETVEYLSRALALHRASGRKAGEAVTLANLATAHLEQADRLSNGGAHADPHAAARHQAEARRLLDQALELHRGIGDVRNEGETLRRLAEAARDAGEHADALDHALRAVRIARDTGDVRFEASARSALATIRARLGESGPALEEHAEATRLAAELGDPRIQALILIDLAGSRVRLGQAADAAAPLCDALALARQIGSRLLEDQVVRLRELAAAGDPR
ncbi:MAG: BTAD domain-containing putative transcriptional regulator [Actinocrinis sp.]